MSTNRENLDTYCLDNAAARVVEAEQEISNLRERLDKLQELAAFAEDLDYDLIALDEAVLCARSDLEDAGVDVPSPRKLQTVRGAKLDERCTCTVHWSSDDLNGDIEELLESIPYNRGFQLDDVDYDNDSATAVFTFWKNCDAQRAEEIITEVLCDRGADYVDAYTDVASLPVPSSTLTF